MREDFRSIAVRQVHQPPHEEAGTDPGHAVGRGDLPQFGGQSDQQHARENAQAADDKADDVAIAPESAREPHVQDVHRQDLHDARWNVEKAYGFRNLAAQNVLVDKTGCISRLPAATGEPKA